MSRKGLVELIVVMFLNVVLICDVNAQDDIETRLSALEESNEELADEIDGYVSSVQTILLAGSVVLFVLGYFSKDKLKQYVAGIIEQRLQAEVASAVDKTLPTLLSDTQKRAEQFLLALAKLLALKSLHSYDEALDEYGWTGNVAKLRAEPSTLRRAIIECLYSAKKGREANRTAAWEALNELAKDDASAETDQLYLRLSINMRKYDAGLSYFDQNKQRILDNRESSIRASTLLRKKGRLNDALDLAKRCRRDEDLSSIVAVAVLQRDLGNFDEVHDVLLPAVNQLLSKSAIDLPEAWHRLLNTFIANSLDRRRPQDALPAAEFVLRSSAGAVELFTVGRLILSLSPQHPKRNEMIERMRASVSRLVPGEATTRCQVVLAQLDGDPSSAVKLLDAAIMEGQQTGGSLMPTDVYFYRCNIGQILTEIGRPGDAIDYLMPAAAFNYGGEAKFRLSIAYTAQGEHKDSARWLEQAIAESPKWIGHARDLDILKSNTEVTKLLAARGAGR